jgi:hypothetical protein
MGTFGYDSNGYLSNETDWNGNQTIRVNNAQGNPVQVNEAVGSSVARTTTISYDSVWERLPSTITTAGLTRSFSYDGGGNPLTRTDTDFGDVSAAFDAEEITDAGGLQAVAVDGGVDAMFERSTQIAQRHAGAQQLALVAQFAGRNPALRQGSVAQQDGQALGVEGVCLVGLAHALLGFDGVGQMGPVSGLLHGIDNPVPVAGGFDGDLGLAWQGLQIAAKSDLIVLNAYRLRGTSAFIDRNEDGIVLVCVTSQKCLHGRSSSLETVAQLAGATSAFMQSPPAGC